MTQRKRLVLVALLSLTAIFAAPPQASKTADSSEAARLNNLGTAYMNQQLFQKALNAFQEASAADPGDTISRLNQGIALQNLGRVDPAKQIVLRVVKLRKLPRIPTPGSTSG